MHTSDMLFHIASANGRYSDPLCLAGFYGQIYSQNGEDGMIAEAFRRIGNGDKFFVEIGIGNGCVNNTRLLLESGWRGVWIDGDSKSVDAASAMFMDFPVKIIKAAVTIENVDLLLTDAGVPECFDFLSLDVDQNTSHVWKAMRDHRARIHCVEYNASFGAAADLEVPYDPSKSWDGTNWFGASLAAMERIGATKQLSLVGCDLIGNNAFFVATDEVVGKFQSPFTAVVHWEPPRYASVAPGKENIEADTIHLGHRLSRQVRRWAAHDVK